MKSMKGRFLKKLKSIPSISTLKQGLVSQLHFTDKFSDRNLQSPPVYIPEEQKPKNLPEAVAGNIGVSKHIAEVKDEGLELELNLCDKVNITPSIISNEKVPAMDNSEAPISSQITLEHDIANEADGDNEEYYPSLLYFEDKCPVGGSDSIILYTTSLRSIRKTFEDCHTIRFLLESLQVMFYERDVSMQLEFREELWRIMGGRAIPPRLFIKGRYIGGADEVVGLHEQGKLKKLFEGIPLSLSNCPCTGCGNMRFVVCFNCNGSRKVFSDGGNDEMYIRCSVCNENGLVKCPICS